MFVSFHFEVDASKAEISFLEVGVGCETFCDFLNSFFVLMLVQQSDSEPIVQIFLCVRVLKMMDYVPDKWHYLLVLLTLEHFLDKVVLLLEKVLIDADREVIALCDWDYLTHSVHPDDNFRLVSMFFCEMFLLKEMPREAGCVFLIFSLLR